MVSNKKQIQVKGVVKKEEVKVNKDIQSLVAQINEKFGENSIRIGVPKTEGNISEVKRIPTGSVDLDINLDGGIPVGRFTQFSGGESSTKTTQSWWIISNALKMGMTVAAFDAEGTSTLSDGTPDFKYLNNFGITSDYYYSGQLLIIKPCSLEECTEMALMLQASEKVQFIFIDSITQLEPMKVLESAMEDSVQMGIKQKMLGEFLNKYQLNNNKLTREGKQDVTLLVVNQLREKIGVIKGDPEYETGGRALKYSLSLGVRYRTKEWIKDPRFKDNIVGQVIAYKIWKNKLGMKGISGSMDMYLDNNTLDIPKFHPDNVKSIIINAIDFGIITQSGAWFYYKDEKFNGKSPLIDFLRENESEIQVIKNQILTLLKKDRKDEV